MIQPQAPKASTPAIAATPAPSARGTPSASAIYEGFRAQRRELSNQRNDLENIPIFLILAWIYVAGGLPTTAFLIYCGLFVLARIAHTICYLNGIQPFRTITFTIGAFTMLAMMIHVIIGVVLQ